MSKYLMQVADYEHRGDLDHAVSEIKAISSKCSSFRTYEERDYEAEFEHTQEYGELDESIYQGYVEFEAPESERKVLEAIGCYIIK